VKRSESIREVILDLTHQTLDEAITRLLEGLLSPKEAAVLIGVDVAQILRWCQTRARQQARREGRTPVPFIKVDAKTIRFDPRELIKWWNTTKPPTVAAFKPGKFFKKKR
jgi:hypothetical protein